jgi:hypothetical protein
MFSTGTKDEYLKPNWSWVVGSCDCLGPLFFLLLGVHTTQEDGKPHLHSTSVRDMLISDLYYYRSINDTYFSGTKAVELVFRLLRGFYQ